MMPPEQLAAELEHPSASAIWNRALKIFGDQPKAGYWMNSPRDIFEGRSQQEIVATGDAFGSVSCGQKLPGAQVETSRLQVESRMGAGTDDPPRHPPHQLGMGDGVDVLRQIRVYDIRITRAYSSLSTS